MQVLVLYFQNGTCTHKKDHDISGIHIGRQQGKILTHAEKDLMVMRHAKKISKYLTLGVI